MNAELQPARMSRLATLKRAIDQGTARQVQRIVKSLQPAEIA